METQTKGLISGFGLYLCLKNLKSRPSAFNQNSLIQLKVLKGGLKNEKINEEKS